MSHLTSIKTTIKNRIVLEKVLKEMIDDEIDGILTKAKLEHNATIRDFRNSIVADFVIRRFQEYDFGFVLREEEFHFVADASAYGRKAFMEQLMPWYARENAIAALTAQGFEIESQIDEDGIVKIIAGKWA